ncbi:MAG: DUF2892 domain-containing protein [bacterium]
MAVTPNIGKTDQIIRAVIAILLFIVSLLLSGWLRIVFVIVGIISLITAITRFCGLYKILGINTCKMK